MRPPLGIETSSPEFSANRDGLALVPLVPSPALDAVILVVAGRRTSGDLLTEIFREAGMRAATAGSPTLVEEIRRAGSDGRAVPIVVVDARPAGVDGFAVAAQIRRHPEVSTARIVLLLASGTRGDAARCRELDVSAYLTKPLRAADVVAAIRTVLETGWQGPSAPLVTRHLIAGRPEPLQVLLAEDDPSIRFLLTRVLEKRGHSVVATANGRDALAALERGTFDVLLTDVGMPGLNGPGLLKAVREREADGDGARRLPVVALTGHAGDQDRRRLLEAGMDGYVAKPFSPEDVFFTLESLTGASESREARALAAASETFDRGALLTEVGGDIDLLERMVSMFREDWPRRATQLREAIHDRRGQDLADAAHALKGSIGLFRAPDVFETARRLEYVSRREDFAAALETLRSLEKKVRGLESSLSALLEEERT